MAAIVTTVVIEAIIPRISPSPTTPTGAGVSQVVVEAIIAGAPGVRVSQVVVEAVIGLTPDGSHGDTGGGGTPSAVTHSFGYAT